MPKITILAVGKMRNSNFADAFGEYIKRIKPFAMISIQELTAESFFDNSNREKIKNREKTIVDDNIYESRITLN